MYVFTLSPYSNSGILRARYWHANVKLACQASKLWLLFFSNMVISHFSLLVSFYSFLNNPLFSCIWCIWTDKSRNPYEGPGYFHASFKLDSYKSWKMEKSVTNSFLSIFVGLTYLEFTYHESKKNGTMGQGKRINEHKTLHYCFRRILRALKISAV